MKSRRRTHIKIFLLAGLLFSLFTAYLYFGLFPGKLKQIALEKIEALTQKKVVFDKALYLPFRGLNFENLKVLDKKGRPIFSARQLAIDAAFIPFFKEKKIVVRNVYLDHPIYEAALNPEIPPGLLPPPVMTKISGQIEVPVASDTSKMSLSALAEGPDLFLPENVYLEQIEIVDGLVTIRKSAAAPLLEKIEGINVRLKFQRPPNLLFDGSLRLGDKPYALISLRGKWNLDLADYQFHFQSKSDRIPAWLLDYQKDHFLILKKCRLILNVDLTSLEESRALFHAKADIDDGLLSLNKTMFQGKILGDAKGLFNFDTKAFERYKGSLNFVNVDVANLSPEVPSVEAISGKILFQPDLLTMESIRGQYQKLPFEATGRIRSFEKLLLDATIRVKADINQILSLTPEREKKFLKGWLLRGEAEGISLVSGSLKKPPKLQMKNKLSLHGVSIKNPEQKIDLANVSAEVSQNEAGISIEHAKLTTDKKTYAVDFFIPNQPAAPGTLKLDSKEIRLSATYHLEGPSVVIREAKGSFYGVSSNFHGKIPRLSSPWVGVQGDFNTHLKDVMPFKNFGLDGSLHGYFVLGGPWNDPKNWDLKIDGKSDTLFVKKLKLEDTQIQVRMGGRVLNIPYLHGHFYHGTLGANISFDLSDKKTRFGGKVYANQVDLHALVQDLDLKQKDIAGTAMFQMKVNGVLQSQETFKGNGSIDIQKGKLWQTDLFRDMGRLPFVTVEGLDQVIFRSLSAGFDIHDKKIWTQNLNIFGDTVDLSLEGTAGFDQSLDLKMNIRYSNDIIQGAYDTGGLVPFMIQQAENSISQYRVSGTLKQPKYEKA